uniref:Uncharacterized protein n=1 Tax=Schistosoma japonicum TaxID=6182 RepID=Q5C6Y4_SCHJA|nr:unknown [Schistosoma japonicum]
MLLMLSELLVIQVLLRCIKKMNERFKSSCNRCVHIRCCTWTVSRWYGSRC